MAKKKQTFNAAKEVRKLARERVGTVPAAKVIPVKPERREKYKTRPESQDPDLS